MSWSAFLPLVTKSLIVEGYTISESSCLGDTAADTNFSAHLTAATLAVIAAAAGLTGAATLCDVRVICSPQSSAGNAATYDVGTTIDVQVAERF